jgi:hypothetical protein
VDGAAQQLALGRQVRMLGVVVGTHRATEDDEPVDGVEPRQRLAPVHSTHVELHAICASDPRDQARMLKRHMLDHRPCAHPSSIIPSGPPSMARSAILPSQDQAPAGGRGELLGIERGVRALTRKGPSPRSAMARARRRLASRVRRRAELEIALCHHPRNVAGEPVPSQTVLGDSP